MNKRESPKKFMSIVLRAGGLLGVVCISVYIASFWNRSVEKLSSRVPVSQRQPRTGLSDQLIDFSDPQVLSSLRVGKQAGLQAHLLKLWDQDPSRVEDFFRKLQEAKGGRNDYHLILWEFLRAKLDKDSNLNHLALARLGESLLGGKEIQINSVSDFHLIRQLEKICGFSKRDADRISFSYELKKLSVTELRGAIMPLDDSVMLRKVAIDVARKRPEAMLSLIEDHDPAEVSAIISAAADGYLDQLPSDALKLIEKNVHSEVYQKFSGMFFEGWVFDDPVGAGDALNRLPRGVSRDQAIQQVVEYLLQAQDREAAKIWVGEIDDDKFRKQLLVDHGFDLD